MAVFWFLLQFLLVGIITFGILNKYAPWRSQHWLVALSTFIGWFFSFLIILFIPLDVSIDRLVNITHTDVLECEEPKGFLPDKFLLGWWRVVYWTSQALTWLLLPFVQSYTKGGSFTTVGRVKFAIYNNALYYALYLVLFVLLFLYAVSKGVSMNWDHLKVLVISASNTWGFLFLVVLLGYGLVEVPRCLWHASYTERRLQKIYFQAANLASEKNDAEEMVRDLFNECRHVLNLLKTERGPARPRILEVMARFPSEFTEQTSRRQSDFSNPSFRNLDARTAGDEAFLVRLNRRVTDSLQNWRRTRAQWGALLKKAAYLEAVVEAGRGATLPPLLRPQCGLGQRLPARFHLLYHVRLRPLGLRLAALLCTGMTLLIMWSECTFFIVQPQLSLAARILHSLALGYHYKYIQITAVALILYLGICAYYTVFHLKIYRYYHLDPNGTTDANSLVFSAMLLCRLTPPLCLNFLGMIHLDTHITSNRHFGVETQFTKLMGHLDVIPVIASGINIYLPVLISVLSLSTWFQLGSRALHLIGIDQFLDQDQITADLVQNGKALMGLERRHQERQARLQQHQLPSPPHAARARQLDEVPLMDDFSEQTLILMEPEPERTPPRPSHPKATDIFDDL